MVNKNMNMEQAYFNTSHARRIWLQIVQDINKLNVSDAEKNIIINLLIRDLEFFKDLDERGKVGHEKWLHDEIVKIKNDKKNKLI